ncbi:MAG: hypothetical protein ACK4TA_07540, partial [Saprospiraceae bacterium]
MKAKINILVFPQKIAGNQLSLNVLIIPRNFNPLLPLADLAPFPAWADSTLHLQVNILAALDEYPRLDLPLDFTEALPAITIGADARTIFETLAQQFEITSTKTAEKPEKQHFARKYLPESYRKAFNFTKPRTDKADIGDGYACAISKEDKPDPTFQPSDNSVSWGKVFAFCLRQPALARKCGFVHEITVDLTDGFLQNGGWIYVDFTADSDYFFADKTIVKRYAARLPKIPTNTNRSLFASVLFPVRHNA